MVRVFECIKYSSKEGGIYQTMTLCTHNVCDKEDRIWLPNTLNKYGSVERHQWCRTCGKVQNKSDDRPKKMGYWMNKLGLLCYELGLTQTQKRLIAKQIENHEYFHDFFSAYGSSQKKLFIHIVSKYCDTSRVDFDVLIPLSD